jgi:pimeloyl-ACP methyl ester carboxylesterase
MFFLGSHGYRCIAHDRRGHGRSSQVCLFPPNLSMALYSRLPPEDMSHTSRLAYMSLE